MKYLFLLLGITTASAQTLSVPEGSISTPVPNNQPWSSFSVTGNYVEHCLEFDLVVDKWDDEARAAVVKNFVEFLDLAKSCENWKSSK